MYSTLENIRTSLKLAWKHKTLWIFALLIAAGGGMNFGGFDGFGKKQYQEEDYLQEPYYSGTKKLSYTFSPGIEEMPRISGASVLGAEARPQDFFLEKLGEVDLVYRGIAVGIGFLIFLIYAVFVGFLLRGWSRGAFLAGTFKGIKNHDFNLKGLGKIALTNMYRFVKLDLLLTGVILASLLIIGIVYFLNSQISDNAVLISVLLSIFMMILLSLFVLSLTYSYRRVLTKKESSLETLVFGFRTFKNNIGKTIKLVLGNFLVASVLSIGLIMIMGVLAGILFLTGTLLFRDDSITPLLIAIGILSGPLLITLVILIQAFAGYVNTFKEFAWSGLYMYIEGIDENTVSNLIGERQNE